MLECGCDALGRYSPRTGFELVDIEWCPLHAAAPAMYKALKDALSAIESLPDDALGMEVIQVTEQGEESYPLKYELEANILAALALANGDDRHE